MSSFAKKSISTQALVIKRSNVGEADRVVTLLTKEEGKIVCIAKGVRKIKSSKRAFLEPGNLVKVLLIKTKSWPLLTQASLISDIGEIRGNLGKLRQLTQILEIVDKLFVEEELEMEVWSLVLKIRKQIVENKPRTLKSDLIRLVEILGFQNLSETEHSSILDYVSELTGKKMRSFEFLKVNN